MASTSTCLEGTTKAMTLAHVNVPPAQTWNYLKIDQIALSVPVPTSAGTVPTRLPRLFSRIGAGVGTEAVSWVEATTGDSRYVEVPRGTVREEPIVLSCDADAGEVRDSGVMVRGGATATIVVVSHGSGDAEGDAPLSPTPAATSANLVRVYAEKGATVHLVEVVAMGDERQHLEGIGLVAEDGARVDARQYLLGGGRVAVGFEADLAGDAATLDLDSRYIVRHHEVLDVNHAVLQRGERTRCDIQTSGILADAGQKTMRETIDLRHGGHGSKGNERETVLVTGDDIVNRTLPVILCDEDDVAGNHGASIGSVSPEQMTYLADRGLSDAEAEALFARALFDDAVIHAPEHQSLSAALDRAANVVGDDMAHDLASGLGIEPASADDPKEE